MNPELDIKDEQGVDWNTSTEDSELSDDSTAYTKSSVARGYRPKVWDEADTKMLFYIIDNHGNDYFFDGVLRVEHSSQRRLTQHPVQTGANITDHSFQVPAKLNMEIGVSDSMDVYKLSWSGNALSKSVNAYQKLREIQDSGQPLKVITRLYSYDNMVIESITTPEDYKTLYSMKALISFQQIIIASVSAKKISASKQTTDVNVKGKIQTKSIEEYKSPINNLFGAIAGS